MHACRSTLEDPTNRISKYFNEKLYSTLAVMDFALTPAQIAGLLTAGLELVASRERYSLRELIGTLIALRHPELRGKENVLARERSLFCSAFVQRIFRNAGIELAPGITDKNTTPEDICRTPVPHTIYVLQREVAPGKLTELRTRLRNRVKTRIQKIKRQPSDRN